MAAVGTYLQVGVLWKVTQIEGHPQEPNNEEAGPIRVTAGLADSSTGKCVWPPKGGTRDAPRGMLPVQPSYPVVEPRDVTESAPA